LVKFNKQRLNKITETAKAQKIMVFGDLMVDQYLWGEVSRVSPEAPVPVINIASEQLRFGGAANVAFNLVSLGIKPILVGGIGQDRMGDNFLRMLEEKSLITEGILRIENRPTTVKTRIIGNNQHVARVDQETTVPVNSKIQERIFEIFLSHIEDISAILIQDYNKGIVVPQLINHVIELAERHGKIITVDPKFENFLVFKKVTVFKPNIKETEAALAMRIRDDNDILAAGEKLIELLESESVLITLGSKGMALFERNGENSLVETKARNVADVSGAGDTVIATLTYALSGGANIKEAVGLSNFAAGIVCGEVGVVPISLKALVKSVLEEN
jgi:rfaE bifunctional protein kinase chain/domain